MNEKCKPRLTMHSLWRLVAITTLVAVVGAGGFVVGEISTVQVTLGTSWGKAALVLWHCDDDSFHF